jgi:hypothetical protein
MNIESVRRAIARFGWSSNLRAKGLLILGNAVDFHALRVLVVEHPRLDLTLPSRRYTYGFLGEGAIRRFAQDPVCDMTPAFLDDALSRGDRCHAILDGDVLASFRWYSRHLTIMEHGLACRPDPRHAYAYHGFTRPQYRGRRLHAIGAARALDVLRTEGIIGLLGVADAANLSSLKSHVHMGAEDIGGCYVLRAGGRSFLRVDASVVRRGIGIEAAPPGRLGPVEAAASTGAGKLAA